MDIPDMIVNRSSYDFETINETVIKIVDQIAAKGNANQTRLYIVCKQFSSTIRIRLIAGSKQDDHNQLWYFQLGNDLDNRRIDFDFYTADISAIIRKDNDFFILLKF